jgi:glycosyltransferase involved in cell wall biosynthesis
MRIVVHTMTRNSQRWGWFSINSVLPFVDEVMVWDTGSTDSTVDIVKSIDSPKISIKQVPMTSLEDHTRIRQAMINETQADWIIIVDSDEIWPSQAIAELTRAIRTMSNKYYFFISRFYTLIGDIYHYQTESAGQYHIGPLTGHLTIRAMNLAKLSGLTVSRPHGQQGFCTKAGQPIQSLPFTPEAVMQERYFHTTHLRRSMTRNQDKQVPKRFLKYKYELGIPFPDTFSYPEVFYYPRPKAIPNPWEKRDLSYISTAAWQTPLKLIHRQLFQLPTGF